jgi:hypothetical protein
MEPQVHAEIENQGNENDSLNAENRWQTVDIDELDFVAAVYDGKWYLGKVITIGDEVDEAKINFMEQCPGKIAGIFRWPKNSCQMEEVNECLIFQKQKVSQLNPNSVIGRLLKIDIRYDS